MFKNMKVFDKNEFILNSFLVLDFGYFDINCLVLEVSEFKIGVIFVSNKVKYKEYKEISYNLSLDSSFEMLDAKTAISDYIYVFSLKIEDVLNKKIDVTFV